MATFGGLLSGLFGQQETPPAPNLLSPSEYASQIGAAAPGLGAANVAFNQAIAAPYARLQRDVENIYDPNQAKLREATTASILEQLGLGSQLPGDLQQQVIQNALQGNAASGFGASAGGRGLVARDLGLTGLDLLNQRLSRAASYTRSAPRPDELFRPITSVTPANLADVAIGNQNLRNQYNTFASTLKSRNNQNLASSLLNLAGIAGGALAGGGIFGPLGSSVLSGASQGGRVFGGGGTGILSTLGLAA